MIIEDAIKMAKADLMCMERDVSGQDEMCNSHKCEECSLNYERGNVGEQKEWLRMAIKALEREPTLDKIRAEIAAIAINGQVDEHTMFIRTGEQVKQIVLDIIDKYTAESEE